AAAQRARGDLANGVVVFDEQQRLGAFGGERRNVRAFGHRRRGGDGQIDANRRAASGRGVHRNRAAALIDDAVDRRQPEPRAFALRLRREEWLERVRARLLVHAGAGVGDGERDVLGGRERQAFLGELLLAQRRVCRFVGPV